MLMWKRGRGREDGSSGREGGRVIRGGGEQRGRGHGFMMCGKEMWPSLSLSSWLFFSPLPRFLITNAQAHTSSFANPYTLTRAAHAGSHSPAHILHGHSAYILLLNGLIQPAHLNICSHPFFLSFTCAGPLAAWPVFQVHSPGNSGPYQGGIPVPPGAVSQVHTQIIRTHGYKHAAAMISCKGAAHTY